MYLLDAAGTQGNTAEPTTSKAAATNAQGEYTVLRNRPASEDAVRQLGFGAAGASVGCGAGVMLDVTSSNSLGRRTHNICVLSAYVAPAELMSKFVGVCGKSMVEFVVQSDASHAMSELIWTTERIP